MTKSKRFVCSLLIALMTGAAAQAQTTKKPAPQPAKKPIPAAASETAPSSRDAGDTAEAEPAPEGTDVTSGDDLGPAPPPAKEQDQKTPPSPLTPEPNEFPTGNLKPPPAEYDQLLSDIAALRSRVAALTTTLFKSKLRIIVETEGDAARITSFAVTLDEGVVFSAAQRFVADDEKIVYEHAVAPGHHVIGVEIEREDARGQQYKTWQTSRFSVVVPDSQLLETHMVVADDSDIAEDFPEDQDGEYDVRVRLRARVTEP
ncbi:MAG TPA: hypothetical protein VFU02_11490 [Polyangiaceae bacterium]|nr:hypothetical protein [Polyangiaceae bacterium]